METEEKKKNQGSLKKKKKEKKEKKREDKMTWIMSDKSYSLERREHKTIRLFMIEYKQEIQEK